MTKQTRQLVMMLGIGVLIGMISIKIFSANPQAEKISESTTPSGVSITEVKDISPLRGEAISQAKDLPLPPSFPENIRIGLTVPDQLHDTAVAVSGLNVDVISWVTIYDEREGKPSVILGAQKVKPGEMTTIVELLRREGTVAGLTYFARILSDDGDGVFNRLTDLPSFSPEKSIIVKFKAL